MYLLFVIINFYSVINAQEGTHNITDQVISCAVVSYIVIATALTKGLWLGEHAININFISKERF